MQLSVSFMRDLDLHKVQREAAEVTGFISTVGGFMGAMASFMTYLFSIFNYQYFESYMISKLYKKVEKSEAHALKKDKSIGLDIAKSWRGETAVTDRFLDPN